MATSPDMRLLLKVPSFRPQHLAHLSEETEPTAQRLNRPIKFMLELLDGINEKEATSEALGWVALWSRGWQILRAAKQAAERDDRYLLVILDRAATELYLHTQLVIEPVLKLSQLKTTQDARVRVSKKAQAEVEEQVRDRLVGYAAWCLHQDRRHLMKIQETLGDVYDGSDARKLVSDEHAYALYVAFFGGIEVENQPELDRQREHHKQLIDMELGWIAQWTADAKVKRWLTTFDRRNVPQGSTNPPPIYVLLGSEGESVYRRLKELDLGFVYSGYAEASQMLHGSSVLKFVRHSPGVLEPDFGLPIGNEEAMSRGIADAALRVVVNLDYMKNRVWPVAAA